jgi:hypothetical protein
MTLNYSTKDRPLEWRQEYFRHNEVLLGQSAFSNIRLALRGRKHIQGDQKFSVHLMITVQKKIF